MGSLVVWTAPLLAVMAIAAMTWALLRLSSEQANSKRQRQAIELSWQGYLESLSHRMRALRSLRAVLSQIRPYPQETELKTLVQKLYDDVRSEIERIDKELERMAAADDGQWYTERAEWDGGTDFHTEIQNLLVLARKHYESQDIEALKDGVRRRVAADYDSRSAELEAKLEALQKELDEARAKLQASESAEPEVLEKEVRVDRDTSEEEEMAIAARYMGGLTDNETLEAADAKISAAKGRLAHAEKQAMETSAPVEKEKYQAEAAWEKQRLRWWEMVHTVRRQRRLLDEATGKASELSELGLNLDFEEAQEFQEMEARTKEMRSRIASLTNENKSLSEQLERFNLEQATAGELRETLNRVDQARRNAERELSSVEAMIEQMEDEISVLRRQLHEEKQKDDVSQSLREERDEANEKIQELEKENVRLVRQHQSELNKIKDENKHVRTELETLNKAVESGNIDGMAPESELIELQQAYDKLNSALMHSRAAAKQAEISETEAKEKLKRVEHERDELLVKYKLLRDRITMGDPIAEKTHQKSEPPQEPQQPTIEIAPAEMQPENSDAEKSGPEIEPLVEALEVNIDLPENQPPERPQA